MEIHPINQPTYQTEPSNDPDPKTGLLIYRSIISIGYVLNMIGVALGLICGLFGTDGRPHIRSADSLLMIICCSYLGMLIAVYALFRGVFFMGFPDAKRASRTFLWGISATAIGMFFISQQYHCVINSNAYTYIWTGVFTTFTLIMMMRFFFVLKNENALNILLSLLLPLFFFFQTLLICYNATGQDHSTSCKVPILKKFIRSGKQKSYYVYLGSVSAGFPARNWHISFAKYQRINTGDSIDIRLRSGRLDLPWFFDADLSKY